MPPRKSNVSVVSNGGDDVADTPSSKAVKDGLSVDDLSLPRSMIARLAKGVLPANTQIHKDALLALHKSATVFVSYLASTANENAHSAGKRTIAPQDVMTAIKDVELEEFLPRLEAELKKYNDIQCDKRNTYRRKLKEEKAAAAAGSGEGEGEGGALPTVDTTLEDTSLMMTNGHDDVHRGVVEGEDRPTKKFKAEDGSALASDADGDGFEYDDVGMEQDDEDQGDDGAEEEEEDEDGEEEDEEEVDDDPNAQLVEDSDVDDLPSARHVRDEALDDDGSESE